MPPAAPRFTRRASAPPHLTLKKPPPAEGPRPSLWSRLPDVSPKSPTASAGWTRRSSWPPRRGSSRSSGEHQRRSPTSSCSGWADRVSRLSPSPHRRHRARISAVPHARLDDPAAVRAAETTPKTLYVLASKSGGTIEPTRSPRTSGPPSKPPASATGPITSSPLPTKARTSRGGRAPIVSVRSSSTRRTSADGIRRCRSSAWCPRR